MIIGGLSSMGLKHRYLTSRKRRLYGQMLVDELATYPDRRLQSGEYCKLPWAFKLGITPPGESWC